MNVLAIKPLSTGCQKTFIHHESNNYRSAHIRSGKILHWEKNVAFIAITFETMMQLNVILGRKVCKRVIFLNETT